MGKGVGCDLLVRRLGDPADQRQGVVMGILGLAGADPRDVSIGREARIVISRPLLGEGGDQGVAVVEEQHADRRPGAGELVAGKEVQQPGNGLTHAEDVGSVARDRPVVADAPHQLEIER